ncbi:MAG: hypothetical protein ACJART_001871 [Maribacter sp.]|jgi:hypothetical protein|tara:strand:+ start:528 stop:893 length:366 start_codon:yes stop_codon:yes gene_type:complete
MRVNQLLILFPLLFLASCNENTQEQDDCAIVSSAGQTLSIELVNAEGENLITNETYSLETIKVFNGETYVNDFGNVTDKSMITIAISGVIGATAYQVVLNDPETDTLVLNFKKKQSRKRML